MRSALLFVCLTVSLAAGSSPLERARVLYQHTEYEASLGMLKSIKENSASVDALRGQNFYMLGEVKRATEALQKAVSKDPTNTYYYHWLGRAFGRRAEMSNVFSAMRYAAKARQCFEKAIELDPANHEAVNDLFEYSLEAPGFLGGGLQKATDIAGRIARQDPIEGHYAQARLAVKRREFHSAEEQFRRAVELAPREIGRIVDLARFLAKQGRFEESEETFASAQKIDPGSPKLMFARADAYIRARRKLDVARDLLRRYLAANLTPDDPPRSQARKLLDQVNHDQPAGS
jgi:tetratricopeptide (TPR) repeat protein